MHAHRNMMVAAEKSLVNYWNRYFTDPRRSGTHSAHFGKLGMQGKQATQWLPSEPLCRIIGEINRLWYF